MCAVNYRTCLVVMAHGRIVPIHRNVWRGWRRVRLVAVRGDFDGEATSRSNLEVIAHAVWLRATWVTLVWYSGHRLCRLHICWDCQVP